MANYIFNQDYTAQPVQLDIVNPNRPTSPKLFKQGTVVSASVMQVGGVGTNNVIVTSDGYAIPNNVVTLTSSNTPVTTGGAPVQILTAPVTAPPANSVGSTIPAFLTLDKSSRLSNTLKWTGVGLLIGGIIGYRKHHIFWGILIGFVGGVTMGNLTKGYAQADSW